MKTTPFTDVHIALGAKMHEFAGFNMPIEYTGIIDEHMTVVNGVGVFDVSPHGRVLGKRPERAGFYPKRYLERRFRVAGWQSSIYLLSE